MNHPTFLKKYSCTIPSPVLMQAIDKNSPASLLPASNPAMKLEIDFLQGKMLLEGHTIPGASDYSETVSIVLDICASKLINLNDTPEEGFVFMIEGQITDAGQETYCSGFLMVDKNQGSASSENNCWKISFYLYDSLHEDCEVKFSFPVYSSAVNPADN